MASDSLYDPQEPQLKGDVILDSVRRISGRKGFFEGIIQLELVGHPFLYQVGVKQQGGAPRLVELHLLPPDTSSPADIDAAVVRGVPTKRLANAAAWFISMTENKMTGAGVADDPTPLLRPDHKPGRKLNKAHYRQVRNLLLSARAMGLLPREYVADKLNASIPTVDRWIREAKKAGIIDPKWANTKRPDIQ